MASKGMERKHYVLVHGVCHGAWCWYKLKPRLESAGHQVTVLDLAASGINSRKIEDVDTFSDYSKPLLELLVSLPPNEKVILVGHSFGGLSVALAMDEFPGKVAVGVFLTADMPDTQHRPSYVIDKKAGMVPTAEELERRLSSIGSKSIVSFSYVYLSNYMYQRSSTEDLELAKTLIRPGSLFLEDLTRAKNFSKEGYGSVPRAFIVCNEDLTIPLEHQRWMIQNAEIDYVEEIKGADHMATLSKPQELYHALLKISNKYA